MLPEIMLHYEHHFYGTNGPQCFQVGVGRILNGTKLKSYHITQSYLNRTNKSQQANK